MSLARLALRLAAIEALCPAATVTTGPYPTVAANRVFDSRIDLIAGAVSPEDITVALRALENKPVLTVYTEEHESRPYGSSLHPPAEQFVELVVEAMIAISGTVEIEQQDGSVETVGTIDAPATDRQHEAILDVLESQVRYLLNPATRAPSGTLLGKVAMECREITSVPQRASDRAIRLAARTIRFRLKLKNEVWPAASGKLPEPLATVAAALPAGSSGAALCASLLPLIPGEPALTPLQGVDIYTHLESTTSISDPDNIRGAVETSS